MSPRPLDVSPHTAPPLTVLQDEPTSPTRLSPCTLYPDGPPSPWVPGHTALLRASLRGCLPTAARPPSKLGGPTRPEAGQAALDAGPSPMARGFARDLSVPSHFSIPRGTSGPRRAQASLFALLRARELPGPLDAAVCWATSVITGAGAGDSGEPGRGRRGCTAPRAGVLVCVYALCTQHTAVCAAPAAEPQSSHTHPRKEVCISLGNGWGRGVAQQMAGRLQVCLAGKAGGLAS